MLPSQALAQGPTQKEVPVIRQFAYGRSGEWLYKGLRNLRLPKARSVGPSEFPFDLAVDWKGQFESNGKAFPFLGLWRTDYSDGEGKASALFAAFRSKYHEDGPVLFDAYFKWVLGSKRFTDAQKREIRRNDFTMRERSLIFGLSYEVSKVQWAYYPGKIMFMGGDREHMGTWLPNVHWRVRQGIRTSHALIQDPRGLLALMNGTFDKSDNFVKWDPKGPMRYGGFRHEFITMMRPQASMATFALYGDGHVELGTYRDLPSKESIRTFVQNRFMVLENGKLAKDSDPDAFFSFHDNIARSYLFTDGSGHIGYLWSLYTPVQVLAPIALKMGIRDLMLLDIHSPLSCSVADPAGPLKFSGWKDYMERSFDLVPNFFRLSTLQASLAWISEALDSRIQTHYPQEAFKLGTEDYFAVFLRNAPEAQGVQKPRVVPAGPGKR